jgi:hypothetical protein
MARISSSLSFVTCRWLAKSLKSPIHKALDVLYSSSQKSSFCIGLKPFVVEQRVLAKQAAKCPREMKYNISLDNQQLCC